MRRKVKAAIFFAGGRASVFLKAALPLHFASALHYAAGTVLIVRFGFDFA
jgi:hypothetical protein